MTYSEGYRKAYEECAQFMEDCANSFTPAASHIAEGYRIIAGHFRDKSIDSTDKDV